MIQSSRKVSELINHLQSFDLETAGSTGRDKVYIHGTYRLASLLQELFFASQQGLTTTTVTISQLSEDPVDRLSRFIKTKWWKYLTRQMDAQGIAVTCSDAKHAGAGQARIYIPPGAPDQYAYYSMIAQANPALNLNVHWLPRDITGDFIKSTYSKSGILALDMAFPEHDGTSEQTMPVALPFVVPGGRFNELYNWDGFFAQLV